MNRRRSFRAVSAALCLLGAALLSSCSPDSKDLSVVRVFDMDHVRYVNATCAERATVVWGKWVDQTLAEVGERWVFTPAAMAIGNVILLGPDWRGLDYCHQVALLAHECTHIEQAKLAGGSAMASENYLREYVRLRLAGIDQVDAYHDLSAETEAEEMESAALRACRADEI